LEKNEPFGRWRKERSGFCTRITVEDKIRQQILTKSSLTQPCDSFILQKLKDESRRRWELEKLEMINDGEWKNGPRSSGKLKNPDKRFFLSMFADSIRAVSQKRDYSVETFARNALIRCGLALGLGGWGVVRWSTVIRAAGDNRLTSREFAGEESSSENESGEGSDMVMGFAERDKMLDIQVKQRYSFSD
jgi:hypothetical protein